MIRLLQTDTWIPTPSRSSKSVPPFTIQLQQENTMENNWHKVEITKENVSSIDAVKKGLIMTMHHIHDF